VEDKKLFIYALVILFGGNLTGIINTLNPDYRADPFTGSEGRELRSDLQRQIDDIKLNDTECRAALQSHLQDYNDHLRWGRDVRSDNEGTFQRHEAQINELYRHLNLTH
jgi:hypothetical protein